MIDGAASTRPVSMNGAMSSFARDIYRAKYAYKNDQGEPVEEWADTATRVVTHVLAALGYSKGHYEFDRLLQLVIERKFIPGGRYLYAAGRPLHQVQNCLLLRAEDTREGWAELSYKAAMALMTGAGIGVDYSDLREEGSYLKRTGGMSSGPLALMGIQNEAGRRFMQGGSRRSAIWAGLNWKHPDVMKFIHVKDWPDLVKIGKDGDFNFPAEMDMTNISVQLDDAFFEAYGNSRHPLYGRAQMVYWATVRSMLATGEPGFSVDIGANAGETLRNACCEVTSADDSDICNLGSINFARIDNIVEFEEVVQLATLFLLAGTVYSDLPYPKVGETREKNRRLGLGPMGIHEWLLQRGKPYGPDEELAQWMHIYEKSLAYAENFAYDHELSAPIATRAVAPTGTIGIIGETTTGMEPIYCTAYKRRYLNGKAWNYTYVVDPTARRLVDEYGIDPTTIEDTAILAEDPRRRVDMQVWLQRFVDQGIASTINLPHPITEEGEVRSFGEMLYERLPRLRGITVYPNGARAGQPLTKVEYDEAISQEGVVFEEHEERCNGGVCGL